MYPTGESNVSYPQPGNGNLSPATVGRKERRYVSSVPITVRRFLPAGPFVTPGVSLDISKHGMSCLVCSTPRAGEIVGITWRRAGARLEVLAKVRHSNASGSGVEFVSLSPPVLQRIDEWIEELQASEQLRYPYSWLD